MTTAPTKAAATPYQNKFNSSLSVPAAEAHPHQNGRPHRQFSMQGASLIVSAAMPPTADADGGATL
jgi:hypothetical protein